MGIDSSANLLFNIGADTGDAESNVARFRTLLGKDLDDLSGEFDAWATKVFGDTSTVAGALTAVAAVTAAGAVAAAGALAEMGNHYAGYVEEVERGSKATGISTENMSGLKFMAEETGTSYDSLVTGLTRFASTIVKAGEGSEQQMKAFARLGITQEQVKAGEKDMMPLLELVADRFKGLGSQVERTAVARELFSRGGAALVKALSLGSEGIREFEKEAAKLGLTVREQDVIEVEKFRLTTKATEAQLQSISNEIGKLVLPAFENFKLGILVTAIALKDLPHALHGDYWATLKKDIGEAGDRIANLAHALAKMPENGEPLGDPEKVEKVKAEWDGLASVLEKVKEAAGSGPSVDERTNKQFETLAEEIEKVRKKYLELKAAGKLTAEDLASQAAALAGIPAAVAALAEHIRTEVLDKNRDAGAKLREELAGQQEKTMASETAAWTRYIAKLREQAAKEKTDKGENLELLAQLEQAGYDRIGRVKAEAIAKAGHDIEQQTAAMRERTREEELAAFAQQIDDERAALAKEEKLKGDDNEAKLDAKEQAGRDRINREWDERYAHEVTSLQEHLGRMLQAQMTHAERLREQYEKDLAEVGSEQEAKTLKTAKGEAERTAIEAQFAALRKTLGDRYSADLQALQNSQGWQGVFGSKFGALLRGNEAAMREWATSASQSHLMVKYSLEMLDEVGQKTFEHFAAGMGGNIASAIVYSKSIEQAMRSALTSTLESLAAEAMTYAIYATGLGFLRLAQYDYEGAANAFTSAAIWGTVGAASAVAGRAIAPSQNSAGASGTGRQGPNAGTSAGAGSPGSSAPGAPGGPHVTVNVWGHVYGSGGMAELASAMNDAVINQDVTLTATNTKTGVVVTR